MNKCKTCGHPSHTDWCFVLIEPDIELEHFIATKICGCEDVEAGGLPPRE